MAAYVVVRVYIVGGSLVLSLTSTPLLPGCLRRGEKCVPQRRHALLSSPESDDWHQILLAPDKRDLRRFLAQEFSEMMARRTFQLYKQGRAPEAGILRQM
jgi:hypothetical protein